VVASAVSCRDRMVEKVSNMRKVMTVPLGASRNYNPPLLLVIA